MARTFILSVVVLVMSLAACSSQSAPTPGAASASASPAPSASPAQATPTQAAAGSGNTLVDAAAAVTDPCSLMPVALAKQLVPKELGPQAQGSPLSCQVTDGTNSVVITIKPGDTNAPPSGAEQVPGLGAGAYVEQRSPGDTYLTVLLSPARGQIDVEIILNDGKVHRTEAIAIAQAVLTTLGA